MTQEIYESLIPYEDIFQKAREGYGRMHSTKTLQILNVAYKALFNNEESRLFSGCEVCMLKAYKRIGGEYFKYKEKVEKELEPTPIEVPTEEKIENKATDKNKKTNGKQNRQGKTRGV